MRSVSAALVTLVYNRGVGDTQLSSLQKRSELLGSVAGNRVRQFTTDAMTYDAVNQFTIDSTGAFLIGELERLDMTLHEPLAAVTWGRDIDVREDVTMADEYSSFTVSTFASPGGINPAGKNWIAKETTAVTGISLDIGKVVKELYPWGTELRWTLLELASAAKVGRPIDEQKYAGMKLKWQMDVDEMVYIGDTFYNVQGLVNSSLVTPQNVPNGAYGAATWVTSTGVLTKTPSEILQDVNTLLESVWVNSGVAIIPTELRVPPQHYQVLVSNTVSEAGNVSIMEFLRANSLSNAAYGRPLNIQPLKWLTGQGVGGTNRMIAYTKDKDRVRYPLVPLQRTPIEYRSLWQTAAYYGRLGTLEIVYPEMIGYRDGI